MDDIVEGTGEGEEEDLISSFGNFKLPTFDEVDPHPNRDEDGEEIINRNKREYESKRKSPTGPKSAEAIKKEFERRNFLRKETVKIVESLLDAKLDKEHLKKSLCLLSKNDFDDVITERSLVKVCGNPTCDHILSDTIKQGQKFKIDMTTKTLFSAEERGMYCSVSCLKASSFIRNQLSDESLWMRFTEQEGLDGLCRRFGDIKLTPHTDSTSTKEKRVENTDETSDKKVSLREKVSFPYIKQEHLEHLQQSMKTLTVKEKELDEHN